MTRTPSRVIAALALVVAALAAGLGAQQARPDFTGKWRIDLEKSHDGTGVVSKDIVIVVTQNKTTLTIEQAGIPTIVYRLDGVPRQNPRLGRGGEATYMSVWEDNRLVTTVTGGQPGQRESRYMDHDEMVDESTLHSAIGPTFARKLYWKKIG